MSEGKLTIGAAIDQLITALSMFEERDQRTIVTTVCDHLQLKLGIAAPAAAATATAVQIPAAMPAQVATSPAAALPQGMDIRTLKDQKKPASARQMACLVAYYLQECAPPEERKDAITSDDIEKYFKQAGYKLPTKLEQLLADSKRGGYFETAGRGSYKLTRVGYNLVNHSMPAKDQ